MSGRLDGQVALVTGGGRGIGRGGPDIGSLVGARDEPYVTARPSPVSRRRGRVAL